MSLQAVSVVTTPGWGYCGSVLCLPLHKSSPLSPRAKMCLGMGNGETEQGHAWENIVFSQCLCLLPKPEGLSRAGKIPFMVAELSFELGSWRSSLQAVRVVWCRWHAYGSGLCLP